MASFRGLPRFQQDVYKLKWLNDPILFCESKYGLDFELWDSQREIVTEFYHPTLTYEDPVTGEIVAKGPYNELWLIAGMRSSKTHLEGTFGAIETMMFTFRDYRRMYNIGPLSPVVGMCVASKEEQAIDTNFAQYKVRLQEGPFFAEQIKTGEIELYKKTILIPYLNFRMMAVSSAVAGEVGRTILILLVDEVDSFETHDVLRSGLEMYRRLTKGTKTFKFDGHSVFCGSPWAERSMSMLKLEEAETDKHMLGYHRTTWDMNPNFTYEDFKRDFRKDPVGALRDWAADPQAGSEVYFRDIEKIQWDKTRPNLLLRLRNGLRIDDLVGNYNYVFTGDPAGPKSQYNGFGMGLAHREGDDYIIDGVIRYQPEIGMEADPVELAKFMLDVIDTVPVRTAVFDTWNYPVAQALIRQKGVEVKNNIVRLPHYEVYKEVAYSGLVDHVWYEPLDEELKSILKLPSGRMDHPRRGSKDLVDVVVQAVFELSEQITLLPHVGIKVI